jgi:hypothetical protein
MSVAGMQTQITLKSADKKTCPGLTKQVFNPNEY